MRKHPDRLVFIDETSVKTNLTRQYGRSLCGKRLEMDAPFGAWGTQTFIAGLKHDNLIAPWVIKGAMDGEAFEAYVRNVLAPELQPGTVVICDNLATHYNQAAAATLREVGCWFLYLPPYSPDLNPIEMAFSKLKAHLRRIGARTFDQMFDALTEICDLFTPDKRQILREGHGVLHLNDDTIHGCYKALRQEGWDAPALRASNPKREPWETQTSSFVIHSSWEDFLCH